MRRILVLAVFILTTAAIALGQQSGSQGVRGSGTINEMSATPDQNQQLSGQRPLSNTGGTIGGAPDNTDRVNGRAFPTSGDNAARSSSAASATGSAASGIDANTGAPLSDQAAVKAAKKLAIKNNSPEANASPQQRTPSPGAEAKTKPSSQTNGQRKQ